MAAVLRSAGGALSEIGHRWPEVGTSLDPATAVMMTGRVLTAALTLLLGLSTVAYAQGGLPKRQMSHGVVTSWENAEGRGCAYVRMAGRRWYSTRIVPALDGFATLHAIRDSNRRKKPIMFSVLP